MEPKTFYLTKKKLEELKKEHQKLLDFEKVKTAGEDVPKIFESEDLNPEFVSYQEDMELLRGRIDELKNVLDHYELIKDPGRGNHNVVELGASVKVETNGKDEEFIIVGTMEANPASGKISNESPVGRAFIGKKVGEKVVIASPKKTTYKIKGIKYEIS